ncbi:GIY-YIG nuclease family protein [Patescibacteria group bacterium]|nr:GIY-YIG nuclease family protein [Patescibacteria group bacterium]
MCYLYLLENFDGNHRYLGSTVDVDVRILEHNRGVTKATRNKGPWHIVQTWKLGSIKEVRQVEYKLKKMKRKLSIDYVDFFVERFKTKS